MNLLLGDQVGHFIVRWSVVCFVILLTSGIILWWPKKRKIKQIKKSFSIKWKAKFKRLNYDLHNVAGFYAFLVLMLIAFTGLMWSFGLTTEKKSKLQSDTTQQLTKTRDDIILQQALKRSPETAYFLYNFPAAKSATINLSAYQSNTSLYDRIQYRFDRYSGKLLEQSPEFKDLTITSKIIALNYDLHTGSAVGLPGKFIAFLSSLIAASLPVTGLLIWLNKKNR
nr:PepSY-associated TM helix domain-containing protein [Pedobacter sp. ASV19]